MKTAQTILSQLGGNQFAVMTGARNFIALNNGLRFNIGRNKTQANLVEITLRWDDTYNMRFYKKHNVNLVTILEKCVAKGLNAEQTQEKIREANMPALLKEYDGIYCDQLTELFTDYTKMNTRLF